MQEAAGERAVTLFGEGHNCAQAVLLAVVEALNLTIPPAVASAFGGGMGRTGETCGAVTGALMALGLAWGEDRRDDGDPRAQVSAVARAFMEDFQRQFASTDCQVLIKGRFATETQPQTYCVDTKRAICPEAVRYAAAALLERIPR